MAFEMLGSHTPRATVSDLKRLTELWFKRIKHKNAFV